MGIEIPGEVTWLFPIVVGQSWPEGDETALRRMADAYRAAAQGVQAVIDEGNGAASTVLASQTGEAAQRFEEYWRKFTEGDGSYLPKLREICEQLADSCDNTALEVEYTKLSIIASLVALAIEIAALVAAAFGTFGASTAGIPIAQQATRLVVQFTFRQLVIAILREVAVSVGIDAAIQAVQVARGDRESWDWGKTTEAAVSGVVSGVVGGVSGGLKFEGGGLAGQVAAGVTRGAVEGAVSTVGTAAALGQDISARDVLMGASAGAVSGGVGGAKDGISVEAPRIDPGAPVGAPPHVGPVPGAVPGGVPGGSPGGSPGGPPVSRDGLNRPAGATAASSVAAPPAPGPRVGAVPSVGGDSPAGGSPGGSLTGGSSTPPVVGGAPAGAPGGRSGASVPTAPVAAAGPSIGSRLGSVPGPATPGVPGGAVPGGAVPGGAVQGRAIPGSAVPGGSTPGGPTPGGSAAGSVPGSAPGGAAARMPGGMPAGGSVPGGSAFTPGVGGAAPGGSGATPAATPHGGSVGSGVRPGGGVPGAVPVGGSVGGGTPAGGIPGGSAPAGSAPASAGPVGSGAAGSGPVGSAPLGGMPMAAGTGGGASTTAGGSRGPSAAGNAFTPESAAPTHRDQPQRDQVKRDQNAGDQHARGNDAVAAGSLTGLPTEPLPATGPASMPEQRGPAPTAPPPHAPAPAIPAQPGGFGPQPGASAAPVRPDASAAPARAPESPSRPTSAAPIRADDPAPAARGADGPTPSTDGPAADSPKSDLADTTSADTSSADTTGADTTGADPGTDAVEAPADLVGEPGDEHTPASSHEWPAEADAGTDTGTGTDPFPHKNVWGQPAGVVPGFSADGDYIPVHESTGPTDQAVGTYDHRVAALIEPSYQPYGPYGDYQSFRDAHSKPDGSIDWPPNQGADGARVVVELPAGTVLDRFGSPNGDFLSPLRPDGEAYGFGERAIMPDSLGKGYHVYVLDAPLTVELARVAPAFDQNGGARQLQPVFDADLVDPSTGKMSVQRLVDLGVLHEVAAPPADGRVLPPDFGTFDADGNVRTPDPVSVADARNGAFDGYVPGDGPTAPNPDLGPVAHQGPIPLGEVSQRVDQAIRNSQVTDAGVALHAEDRLRDLASRVPATDGHAVLDVHTDGDGVRIGGTHYTRAELVQLIAHHPDLAGRPLLLVGCDAAAGGGDSLAAHVARETGQRVVAPDTLAWSDRDGNVYASSPDGAGPKLPPDGGWHAFEPDGTHAPVGERGMPPGHEPRGDLATADDQAHRGRLDIEPQVQQPWSAPGTAHEQHVRLADHESYFRTGQELPRDTSVSRVNAEIGQAPAHAQVTSDGFYGLGPARRPTATWPTPANGVVQLAARRTRTDDGDAHSVQVVGGDTGGWTPEQRAAVTRPFGNADPFAARAGLPPDTRFVLDDHRGQGYGTFQTGPDGSTSHVHTSRPFSPDLNNPLPNAVLVADDDAWRGRANGDGETVATTGRPDLRSGGAIRRDGGAQSDVGSHGEVDADGGHHQGNETGGPGEAANRSSRQRDQNQGNGRPAFVTAETWHRVERDRAGFARSGGTVELIDTFALRDPLQRHPHTHQTRWRVTLADGTTEIYVRSYPNEHNAALWPADF
ncbi:WXG100-like domain-containing protein [Actinosynnema sp. NPDC004786]